MESDTKLDLSVLLDGAYSPLPSTTDVDTASDSIYKFKDFHLLSIDANGDGIVSSQERKVYLNNGDTSYEQLSVDHIHYVDKEAEKTELYQASIKHDLLSEDYKDV